MEEEMYVPKNPFFLHKADMLCAICTKKLETDQSCPLNKPIQNHSTIKAYEVLQTISEFKFKENGPQNVCTVCFKNIASTFKFQQICNKAEELFNNFTQYKEQMSEDAQEAIVFAEVELDEDQNEAKANVSEYQLEYIKPFKKASAVKPFPCRHCTKTFVSRNSRGTHENLHKRRYVCSYCDLSCGSKSQLDMHERKHTGERPYSCEHCEWAFKSKESLQHHTLIHTNERPWICGECSKTFRRRNALQMHLRTHSDVRPHACTKCTFVTRSAHTLKSHLKTHEEKERRESLPRVKKILKLAKEIDEENDDVE